MRPAFLDSDTIAALATPPGEGALAVVRLSGEKAVPLVCGLAAPACGRSCAELPSRRPTLCTLHEDGRDLDRVLVTLFRRPRSYTGEDVVEISCHGGGQVVKRLLELCLRGGARLAEPGEFSQRAFLNGKLDLIQAEAVADLIRARTRSSAESAFRQMQGGLSAAVRGLRDRLAGLLAELEVQLDHSDDPTAGRALAPEEMDQALGAALDRLDRLLGSYEYGRVVGQGLRVAIVGKPNAGKSSLLNRLLKSERAIVAAQPGTTRDTIEEGFDLFGLPAVLVDTAGIRAHAADPVEAMGMERTLASLREADALIAVLDGSRPLGAEDARIFELAKDKRRGVVAVNKSDLPPAFPAAEAERLSAGLPVLAVSARNGVGVEDLLRALHGQAAALERPADGALVTSLRHARCLARARDALVQAQRLCRARGPEECLALELRGALDALGEMTGEVAAEDILQRIFSKFCIGK